MARLPNGLRKSRGDYMHPLYAGKPKPAAPVLKVYSPEEVEKLRAIRDAEADAFIARQSAKYREPITDTHPKIVDRAARVAVEGDTDLNHDNAEAAE